MGFDTVNRRLAAGYVPGMTVTAPPFPDGTISGTEDIYMLGGLYPLIHEDTGDPGDPPELGDINRARRIRRRSNRLSRV